MSGLEVGAEVVFECEVCGWGNTHEVGGPGAAHFVTLNCPNPECNAKYDVRLEVKPLQGSDGSDTKVCVSCDTEKPLTGFGVRRENKDGRNNKCIPCLKAYNQQRKAEREVQKRSRARGQERAERTCAKGTECVAYDVDDPRAIPAILDGANPGPLCRKCQRRAGVAA